MENDFVWRHEADLDARRSACVAGPIAPAPGRDYVRFALIAIIVGMSIPALIPRETTADIIVTAAP